MVVDFDAIVSIDLIEEFVSGKLGKPKYKKVVRSTKELIERSRKFTVLVQDSHTRGDPEIRVWGRHAMQGTSASETVQDLKGVGPVIKKHTYDAFFGTRLERVLKEKGAKRVVFCGVVTDICIIHSVASAFFRGFSPIVVEECTDAASPAQKRRALEYMKKNYGANIISLTDILGK
ncbi:MAG: cysteine hydrolase [Candidatus Thermoplasmatota archaeon]|nr:cysteine hydrolase [Candidatus Thermoplasmatota archaeon]